MGIVHLMIRTVKAQANEPTWNIHAEPIMDYAYLHIALIFTIERALIPGGAYIE